MKFSLDFFLCFDTFLLKTQIVGTCYNHLGETVLTSTHNLCFGKIEIFIGKNFDVLIFVAQNTDCGYMLEPPRRGGSIEDQHSMFWGKIKKKKGITLQTPFLLYKNVV